MIGVLLHGRVWWRIHEKRSRLWVERCIGELARELVHPNVHLAAISFLSIEGCSLNSVQAGGYLGSHESQMVK